MNEINELVTALHAGAENHKGLEDKEDDSDGGGGGSAGGENRGQLKMDASGIPADIRYPTDLSILNEVRENSEEIIDVLHRPTLDRR